MQAYQNMGRNVIRTKPATGSARKKATTPRAKAARKKAAKKK